MVAPKRPRRRRVLAAAIDGATVRENLPCPVVYYPSGGVFIAFAPDACSPPTLCACASPAIEHAVRLQAQAADDPASGPAANHRLDLTLFPEAVADRISGHPDPLAVLPFERGLCHRCNLASPTLRYGHEVEAGRFIAYHGWYVAQAYLRFGIDPRTMAYLADTCPQEMQPYAIAVARAREALDEAGGLLDEGEAGEPGSRQEMMRIAQRRMVTRLYRRACRSLDREIESLVREEFGFKRVGEGWVSETMLAQIVRRVFPGQEVLRRQRPAWLQGLELDVYLPALGLAFEYQGQQHFYPVKAWGGEEALQGVLQRDVRKAQICTARGVTLIAIDYTEPLTETYVRGVVAERRDQDSARSLTPTHE